MTPASVRKIRACQDINALIEIEGPDFVRHAYVSLLCRKPDPSGQRSAEAFLRRGGRKIDLIWSIARSDEGRRLGSDLPGLAPALRRRMLERLPVVGWLLRPFLGLEPVGSTHRLERAITFATAQTSEAIAVRLLRSESLITAAQAQTEGFNAMPGSGGTSVRSREIMATLLARLS